MPKKLPPEIIKFRETLEALRKQHEEGYQDKRIDTVLNALKGIKADVIQLSKYVDDVIKTFEAEESATSAEPDNPGTEEEVLQDTLEDMNAKPPDQLEQSLFGAEETKEVKQ
jgi:hypothetical protein